MGDELREIEGHVDAGIGTTERFAVEIDAERQRDLAAVPGVAQLVRRNGDGRKRTRGLRLEKAEPLAELGRNEAAQRHVVDEHDEPDRGPRGIDIGSHRHVVDDDGDLAFHVDAPGFVGHHDRRARRQEAVGAALVHQRIGPEARRHLRAARLAHQFDMVDVCRAVDPLVSAGQRRAGIVLMEAVRRHGPML